MVPPSFTPAALPPENAVPPAPPPETGHAARPLTRAPQAQDRLSTWLLLFLSLAIALPAMLIELHRPEVVAPAEAEAVGTSMHTRQRQLGPAGGSFFAPEHWVPVRNGRPHWDMMPGVLWVHLLAFRALSAEAPIEHYVLAARLTSVLAGLVTLGAVFWAGASLGGRRTGFFAALVCAASPFFIHQAREASPAIYYAVWCMVSLASALWALRPLRPPPSIVRHAQGWTLCGLAMGMAILSVGPAAFVGVVAPILLAVVLCPNRLSHLMGLIAAAILGVLVVLPWALHAHQQDAQAWSLALEAWVPAHWGDAGLATGEIAKRSLWVVLALMPWVLWLVGAVVQPFSTSSAGVRVRLFIGWSWFLLAGVMLLAAPRKAEFPALVMAVAAAAILLGQLFNQYVELAAEGRFARFWRVLRWPHVLLLVLATAFAAAVVAAQPAMIERGYLPEPVFRDMGPVYGAAAGAALLVAIVLSVRWVVRDFPAKAMVAWGLWGVLLNVALVLPWAQGPKSKNPWRSEAGTITAHTGNAPVFWLVSSESDAPDPAMAFYADKLMPPIDEQQLRMASSESSIFFIIGPANPPDSARLTPVDRLERSNRFLYRHAPQN